MQESELPKYPLHVKNERRRVTRMHQRQHQQQESAVVSSSPYGEDNHSCEDNLVQTIDGEVVCIRCGKVDPEQTEMVSFERRTEQDDRASAADHNAGNGLFNSQTPQQGYVSRSNAGVAMGLNCGKDAFGKKIKPQLKDAYKTGLIADSARGFHVKRDPLTDKAEIVFSRYDAPLLPAVRQLAYQECVKYGLDVLEQTVVSQGLNRIYGRLVLGPMLKYMVLTALLKNKHLLNKKTIGELEGQWNAAVRDLHDMIITGCESAKKKTS